MYLNEKGPNIHLVFNLANVFIPISRPGGANHEFKWDKWFVLNKTLPYHNLGHIEVGHDVLVCIWGQGTLPCNNFFFLFSFSQMIITIKLEKMKLEWLHRPTLNLKWLRNVQWWIPPYLIVLTLFDMNVWSRACWLIYLRTDVEFLYMFPSFQSKWKKIIFLLFSL